MQIQHKRQGWRGLATAALAATAILLTILAGASPAHAANYWGQLNPNQTLYSGDTITSPNSYYRLVQQGDGNLVMIQANGGKPLWANNQAGKHGTETRVQGDGNVVSVHNGVPVWTTHTQNNWNSTLHMQDDANLVVRRPGNVPIWSTGGQSQGNCSDNDPARSQHYANTGQWYNPVPPLYWSESFNMNTPPFQITRNYKLEVRYNAPDRCAYALLTGGGAGDQVYIDRSTNNTASWTGWMNTATVPSWGSSAYTGTLRDGAGFWVRACSPRGGGVYRCTGWF